jgi:CHAD domain-containing protein
MAIRSDPIEDDRAGSPPADPAEIVHEARKAIKRMRALARLLREQLGEQEFARVNTSLRQAAQRLAGARDADVRLMTLQDLIAHHPRALATDGVRQLERQLQHERLQGGEPSDIDDVLRDIAAMRDQLARWSLVDTDFETLAPGLRRIYREGRRRYTRCAREHGRDEQDVHDWRKRVKSLYYALDMLGAKKVKGARRVTRRADRLGDLLGSEHDLWVLCSYVDAHPELFAEDQAAEAELLKRIGQRRRRLRKRALKLGVRLYKHKPDRFTHRSRTRGLSNPALTPPSRDNPHAYDCAPMAHPDRA